MTNVNYRVLLKSMGHHDEGVVGSAILPGEAVRLAADGEYDVETLAPVIAAGRGLKLAKEAVLNAGKTVDDAYVVDDILFFYMPLPGDHVNVLVKTGEDIDVGDYLSVEGNGSGKFVEVASSSREGSHGWTGISMPAIMLGLTQPPSAHVHPYVQCVCRHQ